MSRTLAEIAEEALSLPPGEQLKLTRTSLERSKASSDREVETAWEEEIERRIRMLDSSLAKRRPVFRLERI